MTLGIIWLRAVKDTREIVVTSDSRLSGGQYWDANPKIMLLPRSDAVLSFAGDTADAYPLMLQAYNSIMMHRPAMDRSMDVTHLKGHLIKVFNHSRKYISNPPRGQDAPNKPGAIFVLSGYSWRAKGFRVWILHYDASLARFTFKPARPWGGQDINGCKLITFIGDEEPVRCAKKMLVSILKIGSKLSTGSFDMEPFVVLRNIIRDDRFPSVGGPVQMVKIYEHANAMPVGVYWPNRLDGTISVLGRPLMSYERSPWGVIDPDCPDRVHSPDMLEFTEAQIVT